MIVSCSGSVPITQGTRALIIQRKDAALLLKKVELYEYGDMGGEELVMRAADLPEALVDVSEVGESPASTLFSRRIKYEFRNRKPLQT